jgi:hypothetical protein
MTRGTAARAAASFATAVLAVAVVALPAGASDPKRASTPSGTRLAKSVALKLSDLPAGWKTAAGRAGAGTVTCKSFSPKQSDLTTIGTSGGSFESADGLSNLIASISIFKTASQAQTSWSRLVRPALLSCLASSLQSIANKTTTVKVTSKGRLPLSVPGRRHAGYRVVADVTLSGQTFKTYLDAILQGNGRADTAVLLTSVGQAPATALESKLAATIAARLPK